MKKSFIFLGLCLVIMLTGCSVYDKLIQNGRWIYTEEIPISETQTAVSELAFRFPTKETLEVNYVCYIPDGYNDGAGNIYDETIEYWNDSFGKYYIDGNKITLVYKEDSYYGTGGTEVNETYTFEVDKEKLVLTDNAGKSTTFIYEERVENPPR
ncbi:MAG: hypothetical protein J6K22_03195 [Spirochaetaceae bacterium]|nr:hypothetical protein [Spirochaetaceae bacterium]